MDVKKFYRQILGIEEPWKVIEVELGANEEKIDIKVVHDSDVQWACLE
jgi:hypothetical protein